MRQTISFITLGVSDLAASRAFYAALGWSEIGRDASGEYELVILERELR